jgi:hypothetical protein
MSAHDRHIPSGNRVSRGYPHPNKIERRAAKLYFQLLAALLAQQGHCVTLDDIEPDGLGGWHIHLACDKATIDLLRHAAMKVEDRSNPLWLLA